MALVGAPTPRRHISYGSSELVPVAGFFFLFSGIVVVLVVHVLVPYQL